MHMLKRLVPAILMCAAAMSPPAFAVSLMPLALVMDGDASVVSLHVGNDETMPRTYEVRIFRWSQDDGRDVLVPASELVVTPPIMTLAAGDKRVVRIGMLQKTADRSREHAYRILLTDITPATASEGAGLRLRLQYLLPLFLAPERAERHVALSAATTPDGKGCLAIANTGNIHTRLVSVEQADATGSPTTANRYVLAGQTALVCPDELALPPDRRIERARLTSAYANDVTPYHVPATSR